MDLSIVIINYNTYKLTADCLTSIYKFTDGIAFEIVVVDNASTECNPEIFKKKFPLITLIESKQNLGFAGGNNLGIDVSKGKYILLLNSDTYLRSNIFPACIDFMETHPKSGAMGIQLNYPDGKIQGTCNRFPSIFSSLYELFRLNLILPKKWTADVLMNYFFDHKRNFQPDWISAAFFLFPKKILSQFPNQKLQHDIFMYAEDMQWCYEIHKIGYEIHFFAGVSIIHLWGGSNYESGDYLKKFKIILDNRKFIVTHYKGKFYWDIYKWLQMLIHISQSKNRSVNKKIATLYWES
jgi:GT2 family glycosyltransferase